MATQMQVLIAHTGQRLQVDIAQFPSLDDFRTWVALQSSIPVNNIVALTPQGKTFKFQAIQTEKEIYIYDIRITQASTPGTPTTLVSEAPLPKRYNISNPPNSIGDTHDLQSWQDLFQSRRNWALKALEDCTAMSDEAQMRYREMDVVAKCLEAAVANLDSAIRPIEPKYTELKKWVTPTQEDYTSLAANWERYLELARSIPISPAMVRFMTGRDMRKSRQATLEDLIDLETARKAGKLANTSLHKFNAKVSELDKNADSMFNGCDELFQGFDKVMAKSALQHSSDSVQLLEDIEAVAKKIDTDYQVTLEYNNSSRDVTQASKTASNHTERFLPSVRTRALEMNDMLRNATQARNDLAADSLVFMRSIAEITSLHSNVKIQMNVLNQGEEEMTTFDYLRLIQQLPFMYASFVAEAVRRRDWADKVKTDSSTLVNEMALFQDEELKRRRKWQKMVGSTYGPEKTENNVLGLEVNLLGEDEPWPTATKRELDDFLAVVQRQKADETVIEDINKLINDLNSPTKQQAKRVKAFKSGSMHEAALGRSGLMIRGDDDLLRTLQDDKGKLESKLKTAESRVRRLEGLLHRQSTESRPSIGNLFQPGSQHERNGSTASIKSPRGTEDHRRSSLPDGNEALLHRVAQLEGELNSEKERSAIFEKEAITRNKDMEARMDEANSTKKDLLGNMEALKKEFMDERKSLEEEIKTLKARLEETEDEIEHFGESRENEKFSYDERLRSLEDDVERLTREKKDDALKTQGQVEFLRNEARLQRERNESLEIQLQEAKEAMKRLTKRAESSEESNETQIRTLRELHGQFSPKARIPDDVNDLLEAVTYKFNDVLSKVQSLEKNISILKSDLEVAHDTTEGTKADLSKTQVKLSTEETNSMKLLEALNEEKARCAALEGEVKEGREQLHNLRIKMTEGESGSESMRNRLEDEEKQVADLTKQLASSKSQVGSLEEEVRMFQEKLESADSRVAGLTERLEGRNERAKDLTRHLYTQNERLCSLLGRLGFSVNRQNGKMAVEKIPRAERNSRDPNDSSDPSSSIKQSVSLTTGNLADSADLKLLYWVNADDEVAEAAQYEAFTSGPGALDMELFHRTIVKRVKEVEHTARKMTREARSYRERAHAAIKDSHDKIAFKHFKEGDLALFLPTRNQTTGAWAAFNVGCPHFFLREQESHRLRQREWLVARITRIQERVVDLSKSLSSTAAQLPPSETDSVNTGDEFDNPFDLSDGLRWWLIDAHEDKPGAPSTPGLGKSTVAANNETATADIHTHQARTGASKLLGGSGSKHGGIEGVSKTLSKSLESRRSSAGSSRKALPLAGGIGSGAAKSSALASETNSLRAVAAESPDMGASALGQSGQIVGSPGKNRYENHPKNALPVGESSSNAEQGQAQVSEDRLRQLHAHNPHGRMEQSSPLKRQSAASDCDALHLQQDASNAGEASADKSVVWDSLWSLDVSYPGQ